MKTLQRFLLLQVLSVSFLVSILSDASAAILTYTLSNNYTITGTINGTNFVNATIVMTTTADSVNVESGNLTSNSVTYPAQWNAGTVSFTITEGANIYTGDLIADTGYFWAAYSADMNIPFGGSSIDQSGFVQIDNSKTTGVGGYAGWFETYNDLTVVGSFTGLGGAQSGFSSNTTLGILTFDEDPGSLVGESYFSISDGGGSAVPEPATLALWSVLGLCGVGYGLRRRGKKAA